MPRGSPKNHRKVSLEVQVDDVDQLLAAALARAVEEGDTLEHAREDLTDDDGDVDVDGRLVMLLDPGTLPGCSIFQSYAE